MKQLVASQDMAFDQQPRRSASEQNKNRKWREIEAIMDRRRLKQELQQLDCAFDDSLDELEL